MKITNKKKGMMAMLVIASLTFGACKDNDDADYNLSNQEFVNRAASSNNFEVAAGTLALTKGLDAEVKHYGEHMVADHTAAAMEMKNLASGKGWTVPDRLEPKEQQNLDKLSALSGVSFDREFVNVMVLSHQDAVELFRTGADAFGVPDPDLRSMAAVKLPTLEAHLTDAITLKSRINP